MGSNSIKSKATPLLVSVGSGNVSKLKYANNNGGSSSFGSGTKTTVSSSNSISGGHPNVVITYQKSMDGAWTILLVKNVPDLYDLLIILLDVICFGIALFLQPTILLVFSHVP